MSYRLDQLLLGILDNPYGGPLTAFLALMLLIYVSTARILRATVAAVFVLVGTQTWFGPVNLVCHTLRWWLLGILCVRGLVYMLRNAPIPGERRTAHHIVAALSTLAIASSLWASDMLYAGALAASFAVGMFLTFGLLWRLLDAADVIATFARSITVFSVVVFASGFVVAFLAQFFDSAEFLHATGFDIQLAGGRYSGVFYNANMAGILGATVLPIVLATPDQYLGNARRLRWFAIVLILTTIFLSGSRSAVIGSVFSITVLGLYRFGAGAVLTLGVGVVAVVMLAVYAPVEELDETAVGHITRTSRLSTLSGRVDLWQEGWDAAQGSLVFGKGWAESRVLEGGALSKEEALKEGGVQFGSNLHNAHLQLLVDLGFAGLILFWAFCALVLHAGWRLLCGERTPRTALTLVIFASVVAMMADTLVHGWVFSTGSPSTLVFWGFCAMVIKEVQRAEMEAASSDASARPTLPAPYAYGGT